MKTSDIIILTVLIALLSYLVYAIVVVVVQGKKKSQPKLPQEPKRETGKPLNVRISQQPDGVHLIIPSTAASVDDPSSDDIFPQLINDIAPEETGLDEEFWRLVASIPEIEDVSAREQIANILYEKGLISKENIEKVSLLNPPDGTGTESIQEPDPSAIPEPEPPSEPIPEPEPFPANTPVQSDKEPHEQQSESEAKAPSQPSEEEFANHEFNV